MADLIVNPDSIDSVDLKEMRLLLGDAIYVALFNSIEGFLSVDDDVYSVAVKKTFVRHQFISLIESLKRR